MPAPSIHLQGWDHLNHKRRVRRFAIIQLLVIAVGLAVGALVGLPIRLYYVPAPVECIIKDEPLVHREMQQVLPVNPPPIAPQGPVFSGGQ